ncbi:MAG: (2Fe-2S)-binding protein [Lachnospiraceae bacterium]|nr:(2Fe-2S)-binding protein [Lachnospiraceae bacterium]
MSKKIITLHVNGKDREVAVDERESLYETLRNELRLTSIKKGCEVGECGACSVLLNGKCVDSCIYLTVWAQGKDIVTVEGLKDETNGDITDVQKEFIKQAAVQCGFCTPGFILKAVEIVGANKPYTRDEIKELITGNLCRCTGYMNIVTAIEHVIKHNMDKLGIPYEVQPSTTSFDIPDEEKEKMLEGILAMQNNDVTKA